VDSTADRRLGRLTIELYDGVVPVTADNFSALCRLRGPGGYGGTRFFHIVPGVFCLGGDVQYSVGIGGQSAAVHDGRRCFADENHLLSHNAPGTYGNR
jgi:cyclophilin family peptidyl-prolyl cis-trans isomerase